MNRFLLCWLAASVLLTGCKQDVSGSYLGDDKVAVCWLHFVRTPDDHLTGQLVSSALPPNVMINHESVSLTGAVNEGNITLTGGGFLWDGDHNPIRTFDSSSFTLTVVQTTPVTLKRASLADYQTKLGEQTTRSQAIVSARATLATQQQRALQVQVDAQRQTLQAEQNFIADVDQMIGRMQYFDAEVDVYLGRFPNAEKGYESITAKVSEYVTREHQLVGNPNRAVDRSQLDVGATEYRSTLTRCTLRGKPLRTLNEITKSNTVSGLRKSFFHT